MDALQPAILNLVYFAHASFCDESNYRKTITQDFSGDELGSVRPRSGFLARSGIDILCANRFATYIFERQTIEERALQETPCKIVFFQHVLDAVSEFRGVATHRSQVGRSFTWVEAQHFHENLVGTFLQILHEASTNQLLSLARKGAGDIRKPGELESGARSDKRIRAYSKNKELQRPFSEPRLGQAEYK
jgi:hypothetical protein